MTNAYIDSKNNTIILHDKQSKLCAEEQYILQKMIVDAGYSYIYFTDKIEDFFNNSEIIKLSEL